MKTPDKVYIRPQAFETPWPPYIDENANYGGEEYIRKDALLEWIKSEMNRLWELLPDADNASPTEMEIRYLGQYMQMETLEDKLNSI